jgi:hypothetical protein
LSSISPCASQRISCSSRAPGGLAALCLGLALAGPACAAAPDAEALEPIERPVERAELVGTVVFLAVEGGCWGVRTDAGNTIEPMGLPPQYRKDGLRVRLVVRYPRGMTSTCQIGRIAHVELVEALDADP